MTSVLCMTQHTPEYHLNHGARNGENVRELEWKTNIEKAVHRLDRRQQNTMDVLNDMKELLTKISTGAFGGNRNEEFISNPVVNPPNSPATSMPPPTDHGVCLDTIPACESIPLQAHSGSPKSDMNCSGSHAPIRTEVMTPLSNPASVHISSEKRKAPCDEVEAEDDLDFLPGAFSDDPDFMTQPPAKATRSQKTAIPKKSVVPKKYLKTRGPLHHIPPVDRPSIGRICPRGRTDHPVACNKPCWILHPDFPGVPVAYGRSGISWKSTRKN